MRDGLLLMMDITASVCCGDNVCDLRRFGDEGHQIFTRLTEFFLSGMCERCQANCFESL